MREKGRPDYFRLVLSACVGAVVLDFIVNAAVGFTNPFTGKELPAHLAALLVGSLGGWLFELFRELRATTSGAAETIRSLTTSVEALTKRTMHQEHVLGMLLDCPRHNEALAALIDASMRHDSRSIPGVDLPAYVEFLRRAVRRSDGYGGIHRATLRWYGNGHVRPYLDELCRKDMAYKRLFIILDESLVQDMEEDLQDGELLDHYWSHAGDVDTHWMTTSHFKELFPGVEPPPSSALYDDQLCITYDQDAQVLSFDVLGGDDELRRLLDDLEDTIGRGAGWLREVPKRPARQI